MYWQGNGGAHWGKLGLSAEQRNGMREGEGERDWETGTHCGGFVSVAKWVLRGCWATWNLAR